MERNDDVIDAVYVKLMSDSSCRAMLYGSDIKILAGAPILHKRYLIGRDTMGDYGVWDEICAAFVIGAIYYRRCCVRKDHSGDCL